ncbi:hypothetical protein PENANT_c006G06482 [Penicillium antarcticum]|uniref:BZIP domain-containing protein n=1 Tax=Penicillium antarcticum TaxID=416450 RepID=A0A1V6QDH6_9EURO|nr:uncharacterized protein N7508_009475 [Penicillium antarcticum]KAJ5294654.1 hypothetical protein N7508_009475 [Penicillium antarcticum]OQD87057.1 hypothetical protein PENANT_c006G06482 [Penicillium antarcticum]
MEEAHDRKDVDRLARVRDNQRKSRARKQQYVKELEQRLSVCESRAQQRDIEFRLAMQRVEAENRHLKTLLGSLGISNASVQQYLQVVEQRESNTQKIAIPAVQRPEGFYSPAPSDGSDRRLSVAMPRVYENQEKTEPTEEQLSARGSVCGPPSSNGSCLPQTGSSSCGPPSSNACTPTGTNNTCGPTTFSNAGGPTANNNACGPALGNACGPSSSSSGAPTGSSSSSSSSSYRPNSSSNAFESTTSNSGCGPEAAEEAKSTETPSQEPKVEDPDLCGCSPNGQAMEAASEEDLLNSTVCGIADDMINRYNTKGLDVEEIRRRIWSGFRASTNGTGCRVQNSVLFQVLDEISHDI